MPSWLDKFKEQMNKPVLPSPWSPEMLEQFKQPLPYQDPVNRGVATPEMVAESQGKDYLMGQGKIAGIKDYYPKNVTPIHEVEDWSKVRSIVRALRKGENVPPIVTEGDTLLTGTHRSAANDLIDMLIERKNWDTKTPKVKRVKVDYNTVPEKIRNEVENGHWDSLDDYFKGLYK